MDLSHSYPNLAFVPKTINEFLKELSRIEDVQQKLFRLSGYVNSLEDEMRKIDGFKRELPLCMLLLKDAIERLKEESLLCENLINDNGVDDKRSWMCSVRLWSGSSDYSFCFKEDDSRSEAKQRSDEDDDRSTCENAIHVGSAFVPFKAVSFGLKGVKREEETEVISQVTSLSLTTNNNSEFSFCNLVTRETGRTENKMQSKVRPHQKQAHNKQRRCWSVELHRRFVDAIELLGGSQAATPKQIRELLQVDGLTTDEVKSHLQKYRLRIRKLPPSTAAENILPTAASQGTPLSIVLQTQACGSGKDISS